MREVIGSREEIARLVAISEKRVAAAKASLRRKRAEFDQTHAAFHVAVASHNALLAKASAAGLQLEKEEAGT